MSKKEGETPKEEAGKKPELAPQPGVANPKQADSGDAAVLFFLSLGKFLKGAFEMRSEES